VVRREAFVMAYNDGFFLVAMVLFGCIGVLWFSDKVKAPWWRWWRRRSLTKK
jgi:DHA2 family multidrug resistance protein